MFSPPFPNLLPTPTSLWDIFITTVGTLPAPPPADKSSKPQNTPLLCLCTGPAKWRYSLPLWPEKPHLFQEDLCCCLYPSLVPLYPTILPSSRAPLRAWHHSCPRTPCCALARALPSSLSLLEGAQPCQGPQPCPPEPLLFLLPHCTAPSAPSAALWLPSGGQARLQ